MIIFSICILVYLICGIVAAYIAGLVDGITGTRDAADLWSIVSWGAIGLVAATSRYLYYKAYYKELMK